MKSYQAKAPYDKNEKSFPLLHIAVGGGAFMVGALLAFGYAQWNAQKQQLALMTQMVDQLSQPQTALAPQPVAVLPHPQVPAEQVTRNAPIDLLTLNSASNAAPQATAAVAFVQPDAPSGPSTAEKLRQLVATPPVPALDDKVIADARRLETLAIIQAGVQELVGAVVAGNYDIHTDYEDETFSGRIHFAFVGHEEDQTELERFLANAAEAGIVAHSNSVVDADGKVNGHILLFDLVERALQNGTLEEQHAGEKMRKAAIAMLAKDKTVGSETASAVTGERYYTVEAGDSLAYIALQFYGKVDAYELIFQANRSKLRTPDRIRVGQRLLIPSA
ncbi:LysM domain protein [Sulfitobacter noctilucae]|uniref:LysM peptidoglycan-binding domain-containing protein n=1 Tax=Sulfitobacter noctilucae TaxID=1342302 RepID=UPI0004696D72|nr:LysM peptidoglycan-binding domain-containing protein [Sulfitobacter noctilucae]KIN60624.1 LysM domain protein [Sulfitobacter noctilucae]